MSNRYGEFNESRILKISLLEYLIEVILGIVLCLISVILTFTYKKEGTNGVLVGIIIMYIIAGTSTILAIGRWLNDVIFMSHDSEIHMIVPYSLMFSGLGPIFCGITMIFVSCLHCQYKTDRQVKVGQVYCGVAMTEYTQTQPYTEGLPPFKHPHGKNTNVSNYGNGGGIPHEE